MERPRDEKRWCFASLDPVGSRDHLAAAMASIPAPATLPPKGDPEAAYFLDVSGYVFRAYHALPPLNTKTGEPTHVVLGLTNMVLRLLEDQAPARLCVCFDPKGPSFRKNVYAEYKANRQETPDDLKRQLSRCEEVIDALQLPTERSADLEADDLIATMVKRAQEAGLKSVIVSSDKDLLQLVSDEVVMWDTMRQRVFGPLETEAKLGVGPGLVRDYLALTGDSSDNVPGVPSVGPKTAQKLLDQFGSLDGIYASLDEVARPALKKKLTEHKSQAYLSKELVSLREDTSLNVDFDRLVWRGGDAPKLEELFRELEFGRLHDLVTAGKLGQGSVANAKQDRAPHKVEAVDGLTVVKSRSQFDALLTSLSKVDLAGVCTIVEARTAARDMTRPGLRGVGIASEQRGWYLPAEALTQLASSDEKSLLVPLGSVIKNACSLDLKHDTLAFEAAGATLAHGFDVGVAWYLVAAGQRLETPAQAAGRLWNRELVEDKALAALLKGSAQKSMLEDQEGSVVERLGRYACERAALSLALKPDLEAQMEADGLLRLYEDVEQPLIRVLVQLERAGVGLDTTLLTQMSKKTALRLDALEKAAQDLAGHAFNLASPKQLETVLFDELGLPVVKKTAKGGRSTDVEVLEELTEEHALPTLILEHRQLSKLKGTYLDALPKAVARSSGRVHTAFHQTVAATGRLSSSDPNLQNIPIRTELGREIRAGFVPAEGTELLSADYSQIELRVLAHLADDGLLIDAFRTDADVHRRTASALFEIPEDDVTREQRGQAKTVNYAVIYGQSAFALAKNLSISRQEAGRYIDAFFARYAGVHDFMEQVVTDARKSGYVTTLLGRKRRLPDLNNRRRPVQQGAERMARNTPIQGTAADIMKLAMLRVSDALKADGLAARMLLTVHDELVFEAPQEEKTTLTRIVREGMEQAFELKVPLKVDLGWGRNWGEAH